MKTITNEELSTDLDGVDKETRNTLYRLLKHFDNDLDKCLSNQEGSYWYHTLMLRVLKQKELNKGNFTTSGRSYRLDKDFNDLVKEYGGTLYLPQMGD